MKRSEAYDLVVIGSGPGGHKAALHAAHLGLRVAMVERERDPGGSCVYRGTIPSKTLREAALAIGRLKRHAATLQVDLQRDIEVSSLMERLATVLSRHRDMMRRSVAAEGIDLIHGRGRLTARDTVQVTTVQGESIFLRADNIIIATGSVPRQPESIPVDHENILDSDSILSMIYVPRSLTVLGGGVIATEYASLFAELGTAVTIIDRAPRPLTFLDSELTDAFVSNFKRRGGRYLGSREIASVKWDGVSQVITELTSGETIRSDKMLVAQGRTAVTRGLGLEEVGIECGPRGNILVNEHYATSVPGVYAVGDVIGPPSLAAASMEQGRRAVCHALGLAPGHPFELVPIGIYAIPEMASVGLSEQQAREKHGAVTVGRARFDEVARGLISGVEDGLLKLVADPEGRRLLGVQIAGDGATELIHLGELALLNGNEVSVFLENILNFPTLAESYRIAALDLVESLHQPVMVEKATAFESPAAPAVLSAT